MDEYNPLVQKLLDDCFANDLIWGCSYCNGKIDYVNTTCPNGIGHEHGCPSLEDELDEDFAMWSDFHLGPDFKVDDTMPTHCKACGADLNTTVCKCHRILTEEYKRKFK